MGQGAQSWCTGMTLRDGMGREVGGGSNPLVGATLGEQLRSSSFCKPAPFKPQDTHYPGCNYLLTPFPKANARLVRTLIYISLGGVRRGVKEQSSSIPESRVFRAALSSNSPATTSVDRPPPPQIRAQNHLNQNTASHPWREPPACQLQHQALCLYFDPFSTQT